MRPLLRGLRAGWREIGGYLGNYQSRLLLTACYFTVLAPFGAIARARDPLRLRSTPTGSGWSARATPAGDLERARHMF